MCGISGELRTDGGRPDLAAVRAMTATMADRGPDGEGSWSHGRVALGHRRLKIVDLSDRAAQPMVDESLGLAVSYNGFVYNYRELRDELGALGYTFRTTSDTEVLLAGYHRWGDAVVERLVGMFAFCIAERDSGRVLLGRDRLGIKPLYLAEGAGRLRFASTLPALLAGGGIDTAIDADALHHYLSFHAVVPAPRTLLRGVRKLPPATTLAIEPDGRRTERTYWTPSFRRDPARAGMDAREWRDAVLDALRLAVRRRLVADLPVGLLLSGGLDSSLLTALLAEAGQENLATFSVGFESVGDVAGDEFRYSDLVAERFSTDHHQITVPADRLVAALPDAVHAMSEPMVSHDAVGFYLLSQEVAKSITVVQSGQGADEVFAGYHWYPPMAAGDADAETYAAAFLDRSHDGVNALLRPEYRLDHDPSRAFVRSHFGAPGADAAIDRALRLDTTVMLVEDPVKRVDSMTMAWGLEARVPFLDHELVELAAACPPEYKLADGGKGVLKEIGRRLLPPEVVDRPKGYFPVPVLTHLRGAPLELVRDALTDPAARRRGLFEPAEVDRLLALADEGREELTPLRGNTLWQLGLLELWLQSHDL